MINPDVAFDKLAGFQTADELFEYFKAEQIQGHPQVETACPIALYFLKHVGGYTNVGEVVTIDDRYTDGAWQKECTEPMKEFIQKFDGHEYPELIFCSEDEYCCCSLCRPELFR